MNTAIATIALFICGCGISNFLKNGKFYQFWSSHLYPPRRVKENKWALGFYSIALLLSFLAAHFIFKPVAQKIFYWLFSFLIFF
ncbi:MAG: hypothetical protein Q8L09_01875 [Candidatus Moranbacteria bacterium]|nr:hypothetical protein [Candidatus Moranbacteria bacterium]